HTLVASSLASAGQAPLAPSQNSGASHTPAEARQSVPAASGVHAPVPALQLFATSHTPHTTGAHWFIQNLIGSVWPSTSAMSSLVLTFFALPMLGKSSTSAMP